MRVLFFMMLLYFAAPAYAQNKPQNTAPAPAANNIPLEITADNSLEWQRKEKIFIARGNALAKQGGMSVAAETLTAHYAEGKSGGMKITDMQAEGNVVITSKDTQVFGSRATYDLEAGHATVTGGEKRPRAIQGGDTLEADTLSATMKADKSSKRILDTLEAEGNVIITTPTETVTGASGIYKAATNMAEMKGNVKIQRGPNTLEGDRAEVDMTANTSRIFGGGGETGRVKGVFYPGSEQKP